MRHRLLITIAAFGAACTTSDRGSVTTSEDAVNDLIEADRAFAAAS